MMNEITSKLVEAIRSGKFDDDISSIKNAIDDRKLTLRIMRNDSIAIGDECLMGPQTSPKYLQGVRVVVRGFGWAGRGMTKRRTARVEIVDEWQVSGRRFGKNFETPVSLLEKIDKEH